MRILPCTTQNTVRGISISSKKFNSSFRKRCSNTYSKWVASSFGHKLGSKFRRFRACKNYSTMNIQCVERLLLGVAYVGSLLIERGIHSVKGACSLAWLMSDLCLQNEAYTVCSELVPSRGLCRIFAYRKRDLYFS